MFKQSQLSAKARLLYCILLKYCGKDDYCYPSQETLSKDLGCSTRHVRNLLKELIENGLVVKKRKGWNRSNSYKVSKSLVIDRKSGSPHIGSRFPLHQGTVVPPKTTYLKGKGKKSRKGMKQLRKNIDKLDLRGAS